MYFETVDSKTCTWEYNICQPCTHRVIFMKTPDNRVWEERAYMGDGVFAKKNYFALLAEINMTPERLAKCGHSPEEMGCRLYAGTSKLIKKVGDKVILLDLKYPEILSDDERPWQNRRPKLLEQQMPYIQLEEECECDICCAEW